MDDVKRKLLAQFFGSPSTIVPLAFGAAALGVSTMMDSTTGMLVGGASILIGLGVTATRWILSLEQAAEDERRRLLKREEEKHREGWMRITFWQR